jgi:putative tricarboxylic transport membrane protein
MVVGTAPGSAPDTMARLIEDIVRSKRLLPTPMTIINRTGGGGAIGWAYLNQHPGDGHYLMVAAGNLSVAHLTGGSKISDRDLTPICLLFQEYIALSTRADSPIKDGRDLIERLRKDPGSVSLAVSSVAGSTVHIAAALALKAAGVDIRKVRTVVFDSAGKSIAAMLGGHVDVAAGSLTQSLTQFRTGKARILGVTAPKRGTGELASIPTWREQGSPMEFSNYRGIVAPRGLSESQVAYWEGVFASIDQDEKWRAALAKNQIEPDFHRSRQAREYLDGLSAPIRSVLAELDLGK